MTALDALQRTLAAEHAAVYAYGVIGAQLAAARRTQAAAAYDAHRNRRDRLRSLVRGLGGTPAEAYAVYKLPLTVSSAASAVELSADIEDRVAAAYIELVAVTEPAVRRFASLAVQDCTVRAYGWRGSAPALPGLPDRVVHETPSDAPVTTDPTRVPPQSG